MTTKNWLDEKGKLKPEIARRSALIGGIIGAVIWGGFTIAAGIMLVGLGLWPWVVWPFAFYWWMGHVGKAVKSYQNIVKPQKWEQNVMVNVTSELSPEEIAAAAEKAMKDDVYWKLHR